MNLCSICSLNGKEKSIFAIESATDITRCAWCRAELKENLKGTFNMVFIQSHSETGFKLTPNFEPMCDICKANKSIRSTKSMHPKRFVNYNVNTNIHCKWCNECLTTKATDPIYIDIPSCMIYDSNSSIENDKKKSVIRKLFDCYTCNCS